jgi:hypothetical protein
MVMPPLNKSGVSSIGRERRRTAKPEQWRSPSPQCHRRQPTCLFHFPTQRNGVHGQQGRQREMFEHVFFLQVFEHGLPTTGISKATLSIWKKKKKKASVC